MNDLTCPFDGCDRKSYWKAGGLCSGHRSQRQRGQELRPLGQRKPLEPRFLKQVLKTSCGHWIWLGTRAGGTGGEYGSFKIAGKTRLAHRVSYELFRGPIPPGLFVLHNCDIPLCVNPECLKVGTQGDNAQDRLERGRDHWAMLTHCLRGHPFDAANTYHPPSDPRHRMCRQCLALRSRVRRARLKAEYLA
jgi:HNH endonuclease